MLAQFSLSLSLSLSFLVINFSCNVLQFPAPELTDTNVLDHYTLELPNQSPQHAVPSPGSHGDPSNQGLYSPIHPGSTGTPSDASSIYNTVLQVTIVCIMVK